MTPRFGWCLPALLGLLAGGALSPLLASGAGPAPAPPRRAFRFQVKPEKIAEYREAHRRVDPELLRDLSRAGIRNYSLHMDADGTVYGYLECDDWPRADAAMARSEANRRWQEAMREYFVPPAEPGGSVATSLVEVFYLR